jgi:hypothetical protein
MATIIPSTKYLIARFTSSPKSRTLLYILYYIK